MNTFKLPRKKKKKYQKDNICYKSDWLETKSIMVMMGWERGHLRMLNWLWFYQKRKLLSRNLFAAVGYKTKDYDHLKKYHNIDKCNNERNKIYLKKSNRTS